MLIASVRMSYIKVGIALLVVGVILAAVFWPRGDQTAAQTCTLQKNVVVTTNEKRIQFLESYGWKVDTDPLEVVDITIPRSFNAVYRNYNAIQKRQGYDLLGYRGKHVKRWTYRITNYPGVTQEVRANLLVYNDKVIGGDVSTVALNGFMHGFSPKDASPSRNVTPTSADITAGMFTQTSEE